MLRLNIPPRRGLSIRALRVPQSQFNVFQNYPNLERVSGWDSTAPLIETIKKIPPAFKIEYINPEKKRAKVEIYIKPNGEQGTRYVDRYGKTVAVIIPAFEERQGNLIVSNEVDQNGTTLAMMSY